VHVQRLLSVVKMATVLEECTAEEKRSVVPFQCAKGLNPKKKVKKCKAIPVPDHGPP
jgi:hypothetical protein